MLRRAPLATLLMLAALSASLAEAQEVASEAPPPGAPFDADTATEPPRAPRGLFGVGGQVGFFGGNGPVLQLGTAEVGLRVAAGWAPLLIAYSEPSTTVNGPPQLQIRLYGSFVAAPDLYVRLSSVRGVTAIGLQAGYRYSTLLGSGFAAGVYVQHPVGRTVDLLATGGVLVFPDGETQLRKSQDLPKSADFGFVGPNVAVGLSVGFLLFP